MFASHAYLHACACMCSAATSGAVLPNLSWHLGDFGRGYKQAEYLWAPCSFLEPSGASAVEAVGDGDGGLVTVVPVCLQAANVLALNCFPSLPAISLSVFVLTCPILH